MTTTETTTGTQLYWEMTGAGRPVLLIPGTPGDGGQFDRLREDLAVDHLAITYDRRGTSRSGRQDSWSSTSVQEQANDAASVLAAVGVEPAIVFGTSNGGIVALELALRHPRRVAGLMLHELPLLSVVADPAPVAEAMQSLIGGAMEAGGPHAALEAFLRFAWGDSVIDGLDAALRECLLSNAEMVFRIEMPAFQSYGPEPGALERCETPARVLVGQDQELPFFREGAAWVASHLGTDVRPVAGAHAPQLTDPQALAAAIRDFEASV